MKVAVRWLRAFGVYWSVRRHVRGRQREYDSAGKPAKVSATISWPNGWISIVEGHPHTDPLVLWSWGTLAAFLALGAIVIVVERFL